MQHTDCSIAGFTGFAALAWKRAGNYEQAEAMYRSAIQATWVLCEGVIDKSMKAPVEYDNGHSPYSSIFENPNMHGMYYNWNTSFDPGAEATDTKAAFVTSAVLHDILITAGLLYNDKGET